MENWPVFLAGDFNSQPAEALYALLVGEPLTQSQIASIESSKVIHVSVDPSVSAAPPTTASRAFFPVKASASSSNPAFDSTSTSTFQVESSANSTPLLDQEQGEAVDPDRAFTNVRNARESDGLLAVPELEALYAQFSTLRSAYDSGFRELSTTSFTYPKGSELQYKRAERTYGTRVNSAAARAIVGTTEDIGERSQLADLGWGETVGLAKQGFNEPMYTSFTHYWRLTLDYIFIGCPPHSTTVSKLKPAGEVIALLDTHDPSNLEPGLPKRNVCASDHIALAAEVEF